MLDIVQLPLSTGKSLMASQWFRFARATFQYQHPVSFIRNHRQFRLNVWYCKDFCGNLKPLYWNGQLGWTPALGLFCAGGRVGGCPRHVERRVT